MLSVEQLPRHQCGLPHPTLAGLVPSFPYPPFVATGLACLRLADLPQLPPTPSVAPAQPSLDQAPLLFGKGQCRQEWPASPCRLFVVKKMWIVHREEVPHLVSDSDTPARMARGTEDQRVCLPDEEEEDGVALPSGRHPPADARCA